MVGCGMWSSSRLAQCGQSSTRQPWLAIPRRLRITQSAADPVGPRRSRSEWRRTRRCRSNELALTRRSTPKLDAKMSAAPAGRRAAVCNVRKAADGVGSADAVAHGLGRWIGCGVMATIHDAATIRPTKAELLADELGGPVDVISSYRFDDPDGEVGVEAFVARQGAKLQHVVFTYRSAPLGDGQERLVSQMEHSELGTRWVYDGTTDPVALECFRRAILGRQDQATLELWQDGRMIGTREPTATLRAALPQPANGVTVK